MAVADVFDVAAYILDKQGEMTTMKLQKLLYYSQAWSLVWDETPLFENNIEAWANGPVVREVYEAHRGRFKISRTDINGNPANLNSTQKETIDAVLEGYGPKSSQWLSDLTHSESPWREARQGLAAGERGNQIISLATMAEYYGIAASDGETIDRL
jgi:uncharacterized phage-associated protein